MNERIPGRSEGESSEKRFVAQYFVIDFNIPSFHLLDVVGSSDVRISNLSMGSDFDMRSVPSIISHGFWGILFNQDFWAIPKAQRSDSQYFLSLGSEKWV